jgi:hypothetical protein
MAKWLDRLEDAGRKAVADSKPPRPAPKVERVTVTVQYPDPETDFPGSVRFGYFTVEDNLLTMCDENGTPLKTEAARRSLQSKTVWTPERLLRAWSIAGRGTRSTASIGG